jgi:hypothetical protein
MGSAESKATGHSKEIKFEQIVHICCTEDRNEFRYERSYRNDRIQRKGQSIEQGSRNAEINKLRAQREDKHLFADGQCCSYDNEKDSDSSLLSRARNTSRGDVTDQHTPRAKLKGLGEARDTSLLSRSNQQYQGRYTAVASQGTSPRSAKPAEIAHKKNGVGPMASPRAPELPPGWTEADMLGLKRAVEDAARRLNIKPPGFAAMQACILSLHLPHSITTRITRPLPVSQQPTLACASI